MFVQKLVLSEGENFAMLMSVVSTTQSIIVTCSDIANKITVKVNVHFFI